MSAPASIETRRARYSIVQAEIPSQGLVSLGVLLEDPASDALHLRFRRDMETFGEDEDLLNALADDLAAKASEMGAARLFEYLEDTLSGSIRLTDREAVLVDDFSRALDRLYKKHVQSNVVPFRTHLPRYSLRAAAGRFLDNEEIREQGWIETPEDMAHLSEDMFVAEIAGHSMEPLIPDGCLCVFRSGVTGSRSGRLVLAEDRQNNAYAVKRYRSEKSHTEEWRHTRIRLESLNPDYPSWDLDPDEDRYRIIAEFVRVLD